MSIKEKLRDLVFKKPNNTENESVEDNPYLNARREWNDHVMRLLTSRQMWQFIALASLLITMAAVGGIIHIGSQSKYIPYIVEIDRLGQASAVGPATASTNEDPRVVHACVTEFIEDSRCVTLDIALQRKMVFRTYHKLIPNDPATTKMNEWLNGTDEQSPFKRAAYEMVSVDIKSALRQTPDTWQVDWVETTRDRQGVLKGTANWRALVTVYFGAKQAEIIKEGNPLGIYVRDFSWSRLTK